MMAGVPSISLVVICLSLYCVHPPASVTLLVASVKLFADTDFINFEFAPIVVDAFVPLASSA